MTTAKKRTYDEEQIVRANRSPLDMVSEAVAATKRESRRLGCVAAELVAVKQRVSHASRTSAKKFTALMTKDQAKSVFSTLFFFCRSADFDQWVWQLCEAVYDAPGTIYPEGHSCLIGCEHTTAFYLWLFGAFQATEILATLVGQLLTTLPRASDCENDDQLTELSRKIVDQLASDPLMDGLGYKLLRYPD